MSHGVWSWGACWLCAKGGIRCSVEDGRWWSSSARPLLQLACPRAHMCTSWCSHGARPRGNMTALPRHTRPLNACQGIGLPHGRRAHLAMSKSHVSFTHLPDSLRPPCRMSTPCSGPARQAGDGCDGQPMKHGCAVGLGSKDLQCSAGYRCSSTQPCTSAWRVEPHPYAPMPATMRTQQEPSCPEP